MRLDLFFEEIYPHPIDAVWAALSEPAALAEWLMENDFEPRIGKRFTFRHEPIPDLRGYVECEVLEMEPPTRMVWSWLSTDLGEPTRVVIALAAIDDGTKLTLKHDGEVDAHLRSLTQAGWPQKLAALRTSLDRHAAAVD